MRGPLVTSLLAGGLSVALLAGCSAAPGPIEVSVSPSATAVPSRPSGGIPLAELGFRNGPDDLWLPEQVLVVEQVDMANNVTLVMAKPSGEELTHWLREHLPAAGYEITADGAGSLLFHREPWQGAFTVTGEYSALSLRTDRE
ncbi:hypothetical protein EII34_11600 [Arachnia propionica]|uniref:Lipoprotein n=1 Tax=Arachnia propionica TaxID=1750 RepID=A0A3P1T4D5_9ACTN|nr:hypothetical protein [Arachnia propionica]RRD04025.1 hypothetical protein EII34_11600 [Arachnia propionica]